MKPHDFESIFNQTLADLRLSRGERQALGDLLAELDPGPKERAALLGRALAAAQARLSHHQDHQVLDWLANVTKLVAGHRRLSPGLAEVFFAPDDDCVERLRALIDDARQSLLVCVFTLTDNSLASRLLKAHARGVRVRIITDDEKALNAGSDIYRLIQAGLPVRTDKSPEHMHHKFAVFDQRLLVTGSYNWTRGAAQRNQENIVLTDDERLVAPFRDEFERLWKLFDFAD